VLAQTHPGSFEFAACPAQCIEARFESGKDDDPAPPSQQMAKPRQLDERFRRGVAAWLRGCEAARPPYLDAFSFVCFGRLPGSDLTRSSGAHHGASQATQHHEQQVGMGLSTRADVSTG
jgi:hypothetical protein